MKLKNLLHSTETTRQNRHNKIGRDDMPEITINNGQQKIESLASPKVIPGLNIPGIEKAVSKDLPPYEIIQLPSKGIYYSEQSPLSSGKIMIKLPTAKEQDILTSRNLIQNDIVLEQFLRAIILTPGVQVEDLLTGDMNYLLYAARVLTYGSILEMEYECQNPLCKNIAKHSIDISKFQPKEVQMDEQHRGNRQFEFILPYSKRTIILQLSDGHLQKKIKEQLNKSKKLFKDKIDRTLTTRYKYLIVDVDGNKDPKYIRQFIDKELTSRDSLELRRFLYRVNPNIDITYKYTCQSCSRQQEVEVNIDVPFFWPTA